MIVLHIETLAVGEDDVLIAAADQLRDAVPGKRLAERSKGLHEAMLQERKVY